MNQTNGLLGFDEKPEKSSVKGAKAAAVAPVSPAGTTFKLVSSELNPYGQDSPNDIGEMLLPDGSKFGLFSDPYAMQVFHKPKEGVRNGQYWFANKLSDGHFFDNEIKILDLLSTIRIATRSQIHKALDPNGEDDRATVEFIKRCRRSGIICGFSWVSPLTDDRRKPIAYALTQAGAQAAETLLQRRLPDKFWLQPIEFPPGRAPSMDIFFQDLIANELYCELTRIDRLISWTRRPPIKMPDSTNHYPYASFEVIRDKNDFKRFWIEIFRPSKDWVNKMTSRFKRTEIAYKSLPDHLKPGRVILVADGDSRVKTLAELAKKFMPSVEVRFTTDERVLSGIGSDTFISYDFEKKQLVRKVLPYMQPGFENGMSASEYFAGLKPNFDENEYEE
jgi:hypothetical protein